MREKISAIIILILFVLFAVYQILIGRNATVLNVITPTMIQIDTNGNKLVDENETFCVPDIITFTADSSKNSDIAAKENGLTYGQSLAIGYLADDFAHKFLDYKKVKIEPTEVVTPECRYANIYVEDSSYNKELKNSGFAIDAKNFKLLNEIKFNEIKEKAEKLKLVILNHHSGKYHTIDCKYGQIAHDAIIIPAAEVPKDAKPCQFCHVNRHINSKNSGIEDSNNVYGSIPDIPSPPGKITNENITLILTDFTRIIKPDKNCNHAVCKEFVNCINSSKKSIDVAAYGWAEIPAVVKAFDLAQKRGVEIRMIYDTNAKRENYYSETQSFLSKFKNLRSDEVENNTKLTNMLMHNKFAIFDGQKFIRVL